MKKQEILRKIKLFLFDMDGTLYIGDRLFDFTPQPLMPLLAMERAGCKPRETAVIGDRIYTDVKSGINAGAVSVLVMSGETTPEILAESDIKPDIVLSSCAELLNPGG